MTPRVSIALPVYNGERFVADAVESVLSQDFTDLELIVTDNASTDGTEDICRSFAARDGRVRYARNTTNVGIAENFARGYLLASGGYFKWMAADDMVAPGYLRACIDVLDRDPSIVLVTPRALLVGEDGTTPLDYDAESGTYPGSHAGRPIDAAGPMAADRPSSRFRAVLFTLRGEAIANWAYGVARGRIVGTAMPLGSYFGWDKVLLARLSLHGRLWLIEEPLFIWRHHAGQYSASSRQDQAQAVGASVKPSLTSMAFGQLRGYAASVMDAPIDTAEKAHCFAAIAAKVAQGSVRQVRARRGVRRTPQAHAASPGDGASSGEVVHG